MFKKKETMEDIVSAFKNEQCPGLHRHFDMKKNDEVYDISIYRRDWLYRKFFEYLTEIDHFQNKLNKGDLT